ncbi:MAG: hypothetical protein IT462_17010 [Planctomycetes bacterium]|nr:hypothetical protein [Planctomycetota bacterium]
MRTVTLCLSILILVLTGCGRGQTSSDAGIALSRAGRALETGETTSFAKFVLPQQRTGPLGLTRLPADMQKPAEEITLQDVLALDFFKNAQSVKLAPPPDAPHDSTAIRIDTTFGYADGFNATRPVVMRLVDNNWYVDMKETLAVWIRDYGTAAFVAAPPPT